MDFIGIDVGTSGCKASVVSQEGIVKKTASRGYALHSDKKGEAWLDMEEIWRCVLDMLKEISPEAGDVKAAAVSSLGETLVFLDEEDKLIWKEGITYIDTRNSDEWVSLKDRVDHDILYDITGKNQPQIASVNQYHYRKRTQPQLFEKTKRILFPDSYVAYRICGEAAFDYSTASNSLFYDINENKWSDTLVDAYGIDLSLFAGVVQAGTKIGVIRKKIAEETGLPEGIAILAGCHDQISATVGAGVSESGDAALGLGSAESLNLLIDAGALGRLKENKLPIEPYIDGGTYFALLSRLMHGNCIKWFAGNFGNAVLSDENRKEGIPVYDILNSNCPDSWSGITFLPYLSGTYFQGMTGPLGSFIGMDTSTDVFRLYRSMLEGLSCETADLFAEAERDGAMIRNITVTGGAARSAQYMQIKADITGRRLNVLDAAQAGINGLAMLCAVREGIYGSLKEAGENFVRIARVVDPKADGSAVLERHRRLSAAVRGTL